MARVRKSNDFKIVNRRINNKNFQSIRSKEQKSTKKLLGRKVYDTFGTAVKFARFLIQFKELKACWQQAELEGLRAYNRIIKYNQKSIINKLPTVNNIITPSGFETPYEEIKYNSGNILIKIKEEFTINPATDILAVFMTLFDPVAEKILPFELIQVKYIHAPLEKSICIDLNNRALYSYQKYIIYAALIRNEPEKLCWSSTYVVSGEL